jgi:hypothetical protein
MKKKHKKLILHRETLHALADLRQVVGGLVTWERTFCATGCATNCPGACNPTA